MTTVHQPYVTDEAEGETYRLLLGDSCERLAELDDESVDFGVWSPPFASLFTYSPSDRDLGNSKDRAEFLEHYGYISREALRLLKPGRLIAVHCQQLTSTKATHGVIGLTDFRGDLIRQHLADGWVFHGEVTIDKDPQAQAIRTKAHALMFQTLERDSASSRPALADYLLIFRKPGENAVPVKPDCDRDTWIDWARPVWYGIRETDTLNTAVAKESADERHICLAEGSLVLTKGDGYKPIEQVNPGELVLTHKGRWRPVLVRQFTGRRPAVEMRAQGVPGAVMTPDHKVWTRRSGWKRAVDGARRATPEWLPAEETVGQYVNRKLPPAEMPGVADLNAWWVLGRWLADGHMDQRDQPIISFGRHETELPGLLGAFGGNPPRDTGTAMQIQLRDPDRVLRNLIKHCGQGAHGKHLPPEGYTLPADYARALLDGYLSGDGHLRDDRRRWMATTASRELALGLAFLAHRAYGAVASVYPGRPERDGTIEGRAVHMRAEWVFCFDLPDPARRKQPLILDDGAWMKVRSADPVGEVNTWNLRVADDKSFTAEGLVVKNCPLQLDLIERCIRLWSNRGETVLSPFAGIGSELVEAVLLGRRAVGIELKPSYWRTAVTNLQRAEADVLQRISIFEGWPPVGP